MNGRSYPRDPCVKGLVCQAWVVDGAPADLKKAQRMDVQSTHLCSAPLTGAQGHRVDSSRQQQISATAADFQSAEAPGPSHAMPRTARHKSTLRGGAAVLPPVKVGGGGAANTANSEKRWQSVQRLSFNNTTTSQPAAALAQDANARLRFPSPLILLRAHERRSYRSPPRRKLDLQ